MAITTCPECGGQISDGALQCPHCGKMFNNRILGTAANGWKMVLSIVIGAVLCFSGLSALALIPMFKYFALIPFLGLEALGISLIRYGWKKKNQFVNR